MRINPAPKKIYNLCADINFIQGKLDTKPASTAPIPTVTKKAGKAQQIKVLILENKLNVGEISCL